MARVNICLGFTDAATVAGAWKTLASLRAPANQIVALKRVRLHGEGIAGDAKPIGVRLCRITPGNGSATTVTPLKLNNALSLTVQTVGRITFTGTEPTDDGTAPYLMPDKFHPQGGKGDEMTFDDFLIANGTELALQVLVPSGQTAIPVSGHMVAEE